MINLNICKYIFKIKKNYSNYDNQPGESVINIDNVKRIILVIKYREM